MGTVSMLFGLSAKFGLAPVLFAYAGPYLTMNAWLVTYTWLQHTDPAVPHYDSADWSFIKGCFATIDRPYPPLADFLHHRIGTTHVIHHLFPTIPHYHAVEATAVIQEKYPELYRYDETPLTQALWNVSLDCVAVRRVPGTAGTYAFVPGPHKAARLDE